MDVTVGRRCRRGTRRAPRALPSSATSAASPNQQIDTIRRWVDAGMPSGDLKQAPMPPTFPSAGRSASRISSSRCRGPSRFRHQGPDLYRNVTLSIDLPIDRWITAIDFQPSARSVVHHCAVLHRRPTPTCRTTTWCRAWAHVERAGAPLRPGARLGAADESFGGLGGWVPGVTPRFFPDGIAQPLPSHSNVVMQLHLHPNGKAQVEDGRLAIYFSKIPPQKSLTGIQVPPPSASRSASTSRRARATIVLRDSFELPVDVEALRRAWSRALSRPRNEDDGASAGGQTRGLLWIGTGTSAGRTRTTSSHRSGCPKARRSTSRSSIDNSASNPRNPHSPPERVTGAASPRTRWAA